MQRDKLLYENIKKRRLELNMSQQELAEAVGYKGKSMISQVENGQIDLPITMVKKFAEALKIDAGDLMGWEDFEIVHDGNIIYDKDAAINELLVEMPDKSDVKKAVELYTMFANTTPEVQSAVELLLKSSQQSSEPHQKN